MSARLSAPTSAPIKECARWMGLDYTWLYGLVLRLDGKSYDPSLGWGYADSLNRMHILTEHARTRDLTAALTRATQALKQGDPTESVITTLSTAIRAESAAEHVVDERDDVAG